MLENREKERIKREMAIQNDPGQIRMPHVGSMIGHLFSIYSHGLGYHLLSISKKNIIRLVDMRMGPHSFLWMLPFLTNKSTRLMQSNATLMALKMPLFPSFSPSPLIVFSPSSPSNEDARVEGEDEREKVEGME